MTNNILKTASLGLLTLVLFAFTPPANKLTSNKTHLKFFSTTVAEDIEAHNYKSISTIDTQSGEVVFSVPMQSFEFEKALMQKHYNSEKFLDTKSFPKAKLVGTISNLSEINFGKDGKYKALIKGELSLHGKSNSINEEAVIEVIGKTIKVNSILNITLADYDVAFEKGKPSTNIAKTVEVTVEAEYQEKL